MKFPGRDLIRLSGYDYSRPGFYFVTSCVSRRECLLGSIVDGMMRPSAMGDIVSRVWQDLPKHYSNIVLDAFVMMPNHFHGIIQIINSPDVSLTNTNCDTSLNASMVASGYFRWQKSYHDRIIRNDEELNRIRHYIQTNPLFWEIDQLFS